MMSDAADGDSAAPPPATSGAGDPLAAFRAGLQGLSSQADAGMPGLPSAPIVTLLSNGLNADAGVAQLVSALATLRDGNAAFNATPFAAPDDPGAQGIIAPPAP